MTDAVTRSLDIGDEPNIPAWFHDHGARVFPIIAGTKEPAVKWKDYHSTREQAARLKNYGVPLTGLLVADGDTAAANAWIIAHLSTPFRVTSGPCHDGRGRGEHHFFRTTAPLPKFIHRDGLTIESRNDNQYVLGAGSLHPSGLLYTPADWSWRWEDIPYFPLDFLFDDGSCGPRTTGESSGDFEFPDVVTAGERHYLLFKQIRSWRHVFDQGETRAGIHTMNLVHCHPPLVEDDTFEMWFQRAWHQPDRPFPDAPGVPTVPHLTRLRGLSWR